MAEGTDAPPDRSIPKGPSVHAGVPRRSVGFVADLLLLSLWLFTVAALSTRVFGPAVVVEPLAVPSGRVTTDAVHRLLEGTVLVAASAAFFVVPWRRRCATPGLQLVRLRVIDVDAGAALSWGDALRRWTGLGAPLWVAPLLAPFLPVSSALALVAAWLWFLVLLVGTVRDPSRRGLHDRWANSVVVPADRRLDVPDPAAGVS